jgi:hypothetical protein
MTSMCGASFAASLGGLARAIEDGPGETGSPLERVVAGYLSTAHRDAEDGGCPSASLVVDAGRHSEAVQSAYADGVEGYLAGFTAEFLREAEDDGRELDPEEARHRAIRLLSELVGAVVIARAAWKPTGPGDPSAPPGIRTSPTSTSARNPTRSHVRAISESGDRVPQDRTSSNSNFPDRPPRRSPERLCGVMRPCQPSVQPWFFPNRTSPWRICRI